LVDYTKLSSLTNKSLYILESVTVLVALAHKIETRMDRQERVLLLHKEAHAVAGGLREAAGMIDNLLLIIEERELTLTDKNCSSAHSSREKLRAPRRPHSKNKR
jgi:hypothetical protein